MEAGTLQALLLPNDDGATWLYGGVSEPFHLLLPLGCLSGVEPQHDTIVFARLVPFSPILLEFHAVASFGSSSLVPHLRQLDPYAFHLVVLPSIFVDERSALDVLPVVGSRGFGTFSEAHQESRFWVDRTSCPLTFAMLSPFHEIFLFPVQVSLQFHLLVDNLEVHFRVHDSACVLPLLGPRLLSGVRLGELEVHFGGGLQARLAVASVVFALGSPLSFGGIDASVSVLISILISVSVLDSFPHCDIVGVVTVLIVGVRIEVCLGHW